MSKHRLSRRTFMKALAAGLSVPAAVGMASMTAHANTTRPQRFLVYYVPHGWPIEQVEPLGTGAGWLDQSLILSEFKRWQDKVTVLRGLSNRTGGAHAGIHTAITGTGGGADSIDLTVADALGVRSWLLGVALKDGSDNYPYFARLTHHRGAPTRPIINPYEFMQQLYAPDQDAAKIEQEKRFRRELLGLNERSLERLHGELQGLSSEQSKLSIHLESLREARARIDAELPDDARCGAGDMMRALEPIKDLDGHDISNTTAILEGHVDAMAQALICGAVRVGVIQSHGTGGQYVADWNNGPGIPGNAHMNSHAGGPAERRIREYGALLRWFLARLIRLVEALDVPDPLDPAHTVLENTTILYTSEMCDGSHVSEAIPITVAGGEHTTYFPCVLIGGCAGKIQTGRVIDVWKDHVDALQTIAHIHGGATAHGDRLTRVLT